jgi:hypothetical protein
MRRGGVRAGSVEQESLMAMLADLGRRLWALLRSDPIIVRHLNAPGNWSTWQTTQLRPARVEVAPALSAGTAERRSFRRRRWLAA